MRSFLPAKVLSDFQELNSPSCGVGVLTRPRAVTARITRTTRDF